MLIETERLIFRRHRESDLEGYIEMHRDAEFRRYAGGRALSREEAAERFRTRHLGKPAGRYGLWALVLRSADRYIGMAGLTAASPPHLAFYIAPRHWGQGLGTEAARELVRRAFTDFGSAVIHATVDERNGASKRIVQNLGFREMQREYIAQSGRTILTYEVRAEGTAALAFKAIRS